MLMTDVIPLANTFDVKYNWAAADSVLAIDTQYIPKIMHMDFAFSLFVIGQSHDWPSTREEIQKNKGNYIMWIHKELKYKQNKTMSQKCMVILYLE